VCPIFSYWPDTKSCNVQDDTSSLVPTPPVVVRLGRGTVAATASTTDTTYQQWRRSKHTPVTNVLLLVRGFQNSPKMSRKNFARSSLSYSRLPHTLLHCIRTSAWIFCGGFRHSLSIEWTIAILGVAKFKACVSTVGLRLAGHAHSISTV